MNRRQLLSSALALPLLTLPVIAVAKPHDVLWVVPTRLFPAYYARACNYDGMKVRVARYGEALTGSRFDHVMVVPPELLGDWPAPAGTFQEYLGQVRCRVAPGGTFGVGSF